MKMTRLCILQGKMYEGQFLRTNVTPLDPVKLQAPFMHHCSFIAKLCIMFSRNQRA